jgi:hypothetical protein
MGEGRRLALPMLANVLSALGLSPRTAEPVIDKDWLHKKTQAKATWKIRFFQAPERGARGTTPRENPEQDAMGSRQVRRAALRAIAFNKVTQMYWRTQMTRRDRRRLARVHAAMMYREAQASLKEGTLEQP